MGNNLLSKDDVEDNIMRVVSKDIAAELLEMTFQKGEQIQGVSVASMIKSKI